MATRVHALYKLLDHPASDAAKGSCYLTGTGGPCVDTGVLIDYEGSLTISVAALQEMCEVAGFSFNEEAEQLENENAYLTHKVERLVEENAELSEQLTLIGVALSRAAHVAAVPE